MGGGGGGRGVNGVWTGRRVYVRSSKGTLLLLLRLSMLSLLLLLLLSSRLPSLLPPSLLHRAAT